MDKLIHKSEQTSRRNLRKDMMKTIGNRRSMYRNEKTEPRRMKKS